MLSAKNFIDGLLRYDPDKRLTAEQALKHPWIEASLPSDVPPNLISNVRRGFSSRPSFRSTLDTMEHDMDGGNERSHTVTKDLEVGKKPSRKRLIGKHLKTLLESKMT